MRRRRQSRWPSLRACGRPTPHTSAPLPTARSNWGTATLEARWMTSQSSAPMLCRRRSRAAAARRPRHPPPGCEQPLWVCLGACRERPLRLLRRRWPLPPRRCGCRTKAVPQLVSCDESTVSFSLPSSLVLPLCRAQVAPAGAQLAGRLPVLFPASPCSLAPALSSLVRRLPTPLYACTLVGACTQPPRGLRLHLCNSCNCIACSLRERADSVPPCDEYKDIPGSRRSSHACR